MGAAARLLAGEFGWARMARRYLDLYRGFANQAGEASAASGAQPTAVTGDTTALTRGVVYPLMASAADEAGA
jgi:hypothetical protein